MLMVSLIEQNCPVEEMLRGVGPFCTTCLVISLSSFNILSLRSNFEGTKVVFSHFHFTGERYEVADKDAHRRCSRSVVWGRRRRGVVYRQQPSRKDVAPTSTAPHLLR